MELADLYDIETALEENIRTALIAAGFEKVFTRLNGVVDFQRDRPRLELKVSLGAQNGHFALCDDGNERYDQWAFSLEAEAVTSPENTSDANVLHGVYRAQVRATFSTLAQASQRDTTNFPNHAISQPLRETGTQHMLNPEKGYEASRLTFSGTVAIRAEAFSAVFNN